MEALTKSEMELVDKLCSGKKIEEQDEEVLKERLLKEHKTKIMEAVGKKLRKTTYKHPWEIEGVNPELKPFYPEIAKIWEKDGDLKQYLDLATKKFEPNERGEFLDAVVDAATRMKIKYETPGYCRDA